MPFIRRVSPYQIYLKDLFIFSLLLLYVTIGSIYGLLSPFLGVIFLFFIFNIKNKKTLFFMSLLLIYTVLFEANNGFFMGSAIIVFFVLRKLLTKKENPLQYNLKSVIFVLILIFYIAHFVLNLFLSYLLNQPFDVIPSYFYIRYILIDFVIGVILFS